jgi:hypothetical protein
MGLWQFISVVYGYMTPVLIEFLGKKIDGWGKVTLAIIFCLISGVIAGVLENGLNYNWSDIGDIFGFAAVIFVSSQFAWKNTWHVIFEKQAYKEWTKEED